MIRKIFLLIFCMVLLVGSVSSFEFDNKITYEEDDMKVTFTNAFNLPFIGYDLGTIELKSHSSVTEIKQFGFGKEEVVMYYNFSDWELYPNGLGEVSFVDMKTGKEIDKDYYFVIWKEFEVDVNDYEEICDLLGNGTKNCNSILVGSHKEIKFNWVRYNSKDIPTGNTRIGLKTYVGRNDYIDGVWTIAGKKVEKHITWTGDLNNGLISYWSMNESSGDLLDEQGDNNLSANSLQYSQTGATANTGTSINFTGSPDNAFKSSPVGMDGNLSGTLWVRADTRSNLDTFVAMVGTSSYSMNLFLVDPDLLQLNFHDGDTDTGSVVYTEYMNKWTFVYWEMTSTTLKVYLNNTIAINESGDFTGFGGVGGPTNFTIGHDNNGNRNLRGGIDEVGIWNRSLSEEELTYLWNDGNYCAYGDNSCEKGITITLNSPIDNFETTNQTIIFNGSVVSNNFRTINNVSLKLDGVINETNSSGINNTDYIFTKILEFDEHNWTYEACNNESICNEVTIRTFNLLNIVEINQTYNSTTTETSIENFEIWISYDSSIWNTITTILNYDEINYSAIQTGVGNTIKFDRDLEIPLTNGSQTNNTFYWIFTLTNSTGTMEFQSINNTQIVNNISISITCGAGDTPYLRFNTKNAENPFPDLNATFKSAWNIKALGEGKTFTNFSYEDITELNNTWEFCISPNSSNYTISVDVEVDATAFAKNFYYITDADYIAEETINITLYLLNDTLASPTILRVLNKATTRLSNVLISIQLYDVGTDIFYTVGMGKTNENGEDVVYLNWFDSLYKFVLVQNEETILITNTTKIFETPKIFEIETDLVFSYSKFRDFQYSLTFNNITNNFVLTFVKPSALVEQGCLRTIKRTASEDTEICETCTISASATLYCNIGGFGNGTYISTFYATGSLSVIDWISQSIGISVSEEIYELLDRDDSAFYTILLSLLVVTMFIFSPILGILGLIMGLLGASVLGFTLIEYQTFLGIAIIGGAIIWLIRK